ncbi:MAG: hypothetical protein C4B59_00515 [Candidatus Methanogaster sp.]|uniref:Uncharacterized protein n=1 Tax=Candidatus Methanogaster sp. TaxID=3386292 RepID=A0AC61L6P9_9EURY|nr:MAG: hypothetical protein C4B59_00515 [ANME-2 cluster archaeon]
MERFFSLQRASRKGVIPFLLLFLLIPQASGIGVGASPDRIDFDVVRPEEVAVREMYVINTGDAAEHVMLTVDGIGITADPLEFDLAAKENRVVVVSVDHAEAGEHEGSILITARPSGDGAGGLGLGAGVRVPISFVVEDSISWKVVIVAGLLLLLVTAAAVIRRRRTKV